MGRGALLAAWLALAAAEGRQKSIIVADVGVDDAAGLLWALASERMEVLGVVSAFGCHWDVRRTAANARTVLSAAGRADVPLYLGSRWAYGNDAPPLPRTDGRVVHGEDGFGGLGGEDASCEAGASGAEFIVQEARRQPGEIAVLCFAGLTDLALATLLEPALPGLLRSLAIIGGALFVPGNVSPLAEANFHRDAAAAAAVLKAFAAVPPVLVGLDLTQQALVTKEDMEAIAKEGGAAARLWVAAAETYRERYCTVAGMCQGFPLHDAHLVAHFLEPHLYTNTTELALQVLVTQEGRPEHGMSMVDRRAKFEEEQRSGASSEGQSRVRAVLSVDAAGFLRSFKEHLARLP